MCVVQRHWEVSCTLSFKFNYRARKGFILWSTWEPECRGFKLINTHLFVFNYSMENKCTILLILISFAMASMRLHILINQNIQIFNSLSLNANISDQTVHTLTFLFNKKRNPVCEWRFGEPIKHSYISNI